MSEYKFECEKGEGRALGQLIRQIVFKTSPSWRPVGFSIDGDTTILSSSEVFMQDMVEFTNNLCMVIYDGSNEEFAVERFKVNGNFGTSEFNAQSSVIKCLSEKDTLITTSKVSAEITVYFRYTNGNYSLQDNKTFLDSKIGGGANAITIPSVHCPVNQLTFLVKEIDLTREELTIKVSDELVDSKKILEDAVSKCIDKLQRMSF